MLREAEGGDGDRKPVCRYFEKRIANGSNIDCHVFPAVSVQCYSLTSDTRFILFKSLCLTAIFRCDLLATKAARPRPRLSPVTM